MNLRLLQIGRDGSVAELGELPESVREVCAGTAQMYERNGFQPPWTGYLAQVDGVVCGSCAFKTAPQEGEVEIAYYSFPGHEGQGLATAMARELIALAAHADPGVRVTAQTLPEENASTAILRKLGLVMEAAIEHPEDGTVWQWKQPLSDVAGAEAQRMPKIHGQLMEKLPEDLYIPPDALEVFLDAFEGPLDLLLYLIRRQNLNILDIPVLKITQQYIQYIGLMRELRLELAAEYLVMAALLAEIKSRMLLPRPPPDEAQEEGDPRMELVRRLQEYERFKTASENIEKLPRVGRDLFMAQARPEVIPQVALLPMPTLRDLLMAFHDVLQRATLFTHHQISREPLSVRERMSHILSRVRLGPARFIDLIDPEEGRIGIVVCFLAILELTKAALLDIRQDEAFSPLLIETAGPRAAEVEEEETA